MPDRNLLRYEPDSVSAPGDTLQETLDTLGMSQAEFAARTGRSAKTINEIIKGKAPITPGMALQFERVLGVPASFWMNYERSYREAVARAEERARLQKEVEWLKRFPLKQMIEFGWIRQQQDKVSQVQELLGFFGVASPERWDDVWRKQPLVAFRGSRVFQGKPEAVAAWLRQGELEGQRIQAEPYCEGRFRETLVAARRLTLEPPEMIEGRLVAQCAACGVAVAFTRELPGTGMHGATRWLDPQKALIQLSLRYKTADHLWFTFFHEAGHVLLHGKRSAFLDDRSVYDMSGDQEEEANAFASNILVPRHDYRRFVDGGPPNSKEGIRRFAAEVGIHPGIVVGRLQHEGTIPHSHRNDLKMRLEWASR